MTKIKVIFPPIMLKATGGERETVISASTLEEALKLVSLKYGDALKPWASPYARRPWLLNFCLNGVLVQSVEQLETTLKDGDVITILPAITGG